MLATAFVVSFFFRTTFKQGVYIVVVIQHYHFQCYTAAAMAFANKKIRFGLECSPTSFHSCRLYGVDLILLFRVHNSLRHGSIFRSICSVKMLKISIESAATAAVNSGNSSDELALFRDIIILLFGKSRTNNMFGSELQREF